jgi:hypothetical protein
MNLDEMEAERLENLWSTFRARIDFAFTNDEGTICSQKTWPDDQSQIHQRHRQLYLVRELTARVQ